MTRFLPALGVILSIMFLGTEVAAHAGPHIGAGAQSGVMRGFWHPMTGLDHLIAMIAVGLWAAIIGGRAIWVLPLVFPLVMALGAAMGMMGIALPMVETGIALSGLVLGLIIALKLTAPIGVAAAVVGGFALFHGHAHGTELPGTVGGLGYGAGFVTGTALLHMVGIVLATLMRGGLGARALQGTGASIALAGGAFLFGLA
jgi:urease accessory protein